MAIGSRKRRLTLEDSLAAKPVRNQLVTDRKADSGETVLEIPRRNDWWTRTLRLLFYIPAQYEVRLDEIGAWVWQHCDGNASVAEIVEQLAGQFDLGQEEAQKALLQYLGTLARKRLVGFVVGAVDESA